MTKDGSSGGSGAGSAHWDARIQSPQTASFSRGFPGAAKNCNSPLHPWLGQKKRGRPDSILTRIACPLNSVPQIKQTRSSLKSDQARSLSYSCRRASLGWLCLWGMHGFMEGGEKCSFPNRCARRMGLVGKELISRSRHSPATVRARSGAGRFLYGKDGESVVVRKRQTPRKRTACGAFVVGREMLERGTRRRERLLEPRVSMREPFWLSR